MAISVHITIATRVPVQCDCDTVLPCVCECQNLTGCSCVFSFLRKNCIGPSQRWVFHSSGDSVLRYVSLEYQLSVSADIPLRKKKGDFNKES